MNRTSRFHADAPLAACEMSRRFPVYAFPVREQGRKSPVFLAGVRRARGMRTPAVRR